jgi:SAM-dependent methyltransferase
VNSAWSSRLRELRGRFVSSIYATHNHSPKIVEAINRLLTQLGNQGLGLNVGAGPTRLHSRLINLDLVAGPTVDVRASAERLPFADEVFDLVVSQEVLEHVRDPFRAMKEMRRVLKKDGILYCQVPFIIGYHPGPTDFWRFTREGIRQLVEQANFECLEITMAVGAGTGFYRIAVEFVAVLVSRFASSLYLPVKGSFSLILYPLKWLDPLLNKGPGVDRIPGGYLVIARCKLHEFCGT